MDHGRLPERLTDNLNSITIPPFRRVGDMHLGIDFGTFYSSATLMTGTTIKLVNDPVRHGYAFPSDIFLSDDGNALVGQAAENQRFQDLSRYLREFKRDLGQDIPIILGDCKWRVDELVTEILKKLKPEEMKQLREVTGECGHSCAERLGMRENSSAKGLIPLALERQQFWHQRANDFLDTDRRTLAAASVLARSYQRIVFHLNEAKKHLYL